MNVILGDSRVLTMKRSNLSWNLREVEDIWGSPGGNFRTCLDLVDDNIIYHHPPITYGTTHYYIATGICDITTKLTKPGYQEIVFRSDEGLADKIKTDISKVENHILKQAALPIFCTIYPMSLKVWNCQRLKQNKTKYLKHENEYSNMQEDLNKTVEMINDYLIKTNIRNCVATPLTHLAINKSRRGKQYIYFNDLIDGCHPDSPAISKMVVSINKALARNKHLH